MRLNVPGAAFGTNVAEAIKGLGSTEEKVGDELFSRAFAIQQLRNESEATNGTSYLLGQSDKLVTDFEGQKRGLNAVNGEAAHRQAQQDLWQRTRDGLSNPMAQKMFDAKSLGIIARATSRGAWHAAQENRSATSNAYQSEIDAAIDTAINAKTPEEFKQKIDQIDSTTKDFGAANGLAPESAEQLAFKYKSKAEANYIKGVNRRDPVLARKLMDEAIEAGRLHGSDRDAIEGPIHSQLLSTSASHFTDQNEKEWRDPESWAAAHGRARATGMDYTFGTNLMSAGMEYKRATGRDVKIESLVRTYEEQARIRAEHEAMRGGVEANPAAQPGTSKHEFGRAADVDPAFADWLKQGNNAQKFGLEFLSGKTGVNDPNHVQLAGDAPLRRTRTYDINERDYVEGAIDKTKAGLPNAPPEMLDRVRVEATNLYRRNAALDKQEDVQNEETIREALHRDNPPRTMDDLFKLDPSYQDTWNKLPVKVQDRFVKQMNRDFVTDPAEYHRYLGMASSEETIKDFVKPETYDAIQQSEGLSRAKKDELTKLFFKLRDKPEHDPGVAFAWRQIRYSLPSEFQKAGDLQNEYKGALQTMLRLYQENHVKAFPKGQDLIDIGQRLQAEIAPPEGISDNPVYRFFHPQPRLFEAVPPATERTKIEETLTKMIGAKPSEEMINQVYIRDQYQKLYGSAK
jgi:hypothetical protein